MGGENIRFHPEIKKDHPPARMPARDFFFWTLMIISPGRTVFPLRVSVFKGALSR
jgi:hypothetical protein